MSRLNQEEYEVRISRLAEATNADPELMGVIEELRADYTESIAFDPATYDQEWQSKLDKVTQERDTAIAQRDETRRLYRERFFSGATQTQQGVERPKGLVAILRGGN